MTDSGASPFGPSWYAATMVVAPERAPLTQDIDVDVCIIGAGLAGLTAAREIARGGQSVAILEAQRIAWSASGQGSGVVSPGFSEQLENIIERVGATRAKTLWRLSAIGADYVRASIRDAGIPEVGLVDGGLAVQRVDDENRAHHYAAMLRDDFETQADMWPAERLREHVKSPAYFQAVHLPGAFHIHPLNYALGLAGIAERAGVSIFENSPALSIDAAGIRKWVKTPNGRVRAATIVLAEGANLGSLLPQVGETIVPIWHNCAVTAPLGEHLADWIAYTGAVVDMRRGGDTFRLVGGDRLLWGGRLTAQMASRSRLEKLIRSDIHRIFPPRDTLKVDYVWSRMVNYAVHKMPQIGEVAPGLWLAGAFGDHDLNTTAMAGELLAGAITQGDDRWRLFSDYELVWAGGRAGRAMVQMAHASARRRANFAERAFTYRCKVRGVVEKMAGIGLKYCSAMKQYGLAVKPYGSAIKSKCQTAFHASRALIVSKLKSLMPAPKALSSVETGGDMLNDPPGAP